MDNGYMDETSGARLDSHLYHITQNGYCFEFALLF